MNRQNSRDCFINSWVTQTASVLSQSSGKNWAGKLDPRSSEATGDIYVIFATGVELRGEFAFRLRTPDALQFVAALLGDDGATTFSPDHREALNELFRQIAGLVVTDIKAATGNVEFTLQASAAPAWDAVSAGYAIFALEGITAEMAILFSPELDEALRLPEQKSAPCADVTQLTSQGNLDLLMDVELAATLRFGERRLLLREILELSSGAVVELDRQVHEAVDLLVDNHLVARGEVVIVGGNYGLRVTEVATAAQRVQSIP